MSCVKKIYFVPICLCLGQMLSAQVQNSGNQKKAPFTLRGYVSASANFYSSNEVLDSRPTYGWNVNGNFTGKINGITLPLSFVMNQYGNSYSSPYFQFGISPTYKWAKLLLGYRYINFSPLTYGWQTFKGVGIELNPKLFRFAAFYGRLNKAFNEDTIPGRFRLPQYSRTGYGLKIGVGNASRYFDIMYFHAKDDSTSASILKDNTKNYVRAQENAVVGSSFKYTMLKKIVFTGDMALSGIITDLAAARRIGNISNQKILRFIDDFLPDKGILASYAGQSSLTYTNSKFNSSVAYRRVAPDFKSLGTPYLLNDVELISLNNNAYVANGKLNISTNLSQQHNDLNKNLYAELRTQVGSINMNAVLSQHLNLNLNYSGYNLRQKNGNPGLPDSLRLNDTLFLHQQISQVNISPSYNLTKGNNMHFINTSISLQKLDDKNPTTRAMSNSNNISTSVNYTLSFIKQALNFSLGYLFSRYKQEANSYKSNGVTLGSSAQLLKNKSLNVQGSIGYYVNKFASTSNQKSLSYSGNISYSAKRHSFNLFANYIYTPPRNEIIDAINKTFPYAVATKNMYGGVSYTYSFY